LVKILRQTGGVAWIRRRRVLGHRKSQQLPPSMAKNETYEEPPKGNRRYDKEINGWRLFCVPETAAPSRLRNWQP
jgi:hypothetical protein